ncbi:hypothetical protein [Salinirarus marinus]|uniref:hypothetical protein n=1 Tax=Salinirarus marinus TaxID=3068310 RepID=UPI003C6C73B8
MADKKFTLLELHLDEGSIQFGPSQMGDVVGKRKTEAAPTGDGDANADADESADAGGCSCPGGRAGKLLAVLVVALVVAVAAKKLLGGDEALDELDELDDLAE